MTSTNKLRNKAQINDVQVNLELASITRRHAFIVSYVAIVVYPFWGMLDYLFAGELWVLFLTIRFSESLLIGVGIFMVKRLSLKPEVLGYIVFLGIALQISYMCNNIPETSLLTYFIGFSTLFIAANLIIIWKPINPVIILLLTLTSYIIFFFLFSEINFKYIIKNGFLLFLTLSITSTFVAWLHFSFRRRDVISRLELAQSNENLYKAYQEITDNLKYAKRIQEAVLLKNERVNCVFNDYFIILRPKGLVSGDFFWTSNFEFYKQTGKVAIAAVDCTGHGISGAMLTFLGETKLNQIVNIEQESSPDKILSQLNLGVREMLQQDIKDTQDGMDIAMCVVDHKTRRVEFAGAHNPLVYVQDGEVKQIKGDRMSIGGKQFSKKKKFQTHIIELSDEPTSFYIFSDGFVDQTGGPFGHKFMIRHFRKLLSSISDKSMEEQKEILEKTFDDWKNGKDQIDDMLVIGFNL